MANQKVVEEIISALRTENTPHVIKLKDSITPKSFYRYRKLENNTFDCLKRNTIWLSNYKELNDPFECFTSFNIDVLIREYFLETDFEKVFESTFGFPLLLNEIHAIRHSDNPIETYNNICESKKVAKFTRRKTSDIENGIKMKLEEYREFAYMGCFSEKRDSLLMWSHYADYGKGICIEYNLDKIDQSYLFPVLYSKDIHIFSPKHSNVPSRSLIKGLDWEYEQEWRIVYYSEHMKSDNHHLKIPSPIKIILGPRFEDNNSVEKETLRSFAEKNEIPLIKTTLHNFEYKLLIED